MDTPLPQSAAEFVRTLAIPALEAELDRLDAERKAVALLLRSARASERSKKRAERLRSESQT